MSGENQTNPTKAIHPVYTVTNIQTKVRVLDGTKVTYSSWVRLFKLHAKGYKVLSHINGTASPAKTDPTYDTWSEIDAIVLQWIYGTISDDLLGQVLDPASTAYEAWSKLQNIFLNNKGSRAAALEHEFNNLTLRAMTSLEAYCQRLKDLSGQLNDVECPVNEKRLVLQLVRGLPSEFDTVAAYINQTSPTWDTACSMLQLENQRQRARDTHSPVEVAATVDHESGPNPPPRRGDFTNKNRPSQQRNSNRRFPPSRSQNRENPAPPSRQQSVHQNNRRNLPPGQNRPSWSTYPPPYWAAPWWASPPPCPYPTQPGWASPWPAPPTQQQQGRPPQAHITEVNPLEPSELGAAFSAMTLDPNDEQWYMDSGATTHLTGDAGLQHWDAPNEAQ
ncbi:uncharacterized protein LOC111921823 [Lactuca sativa]|uniref:uncharacterized protein LOC111921823 n=1 Tax=Lactuca sativa TaxID=4236 RepID=UPI0022B00EC7|nr:uncharacterized protein LOC111921823 [Lactuca sativa]